MSNYMMSCNETKHADDLAVRLHTSRSITGGNHQDQIMIYFLYFDRINFLSQKKSFNF